MIGTTTLGVNLISTYSPVKCEEGGGAARNLRRWLRTSSHPQLAVDRRRGRQGRALAVSRSPRLPTAAGEDGGRVARPRPQPPSLVAEAAPPSLVLWGSDRSCCASVAEQVQLRGATGGPDVRPAARRWAIVGPAERSFKKRL
ncbi:hypothetical protein GW17_00032209 [Ensete ventricosum]|nr:hypothetical protein GW17_00032209 [Ensete ventricosum]